MIVAWPRALLVWPRHPPFAVASRAFDVRTDHWSGGGSSIPSTRSVFGTARRGGPARRIALPEARGRVLQNARKPGPFPAGTTMRARAGFASGSTRRSTTRGVFIDLSRPLTPRRETVYADDDVDPVRDSSDLIRTPRSLAARRGNASIAPRSPSPGSPRRSRETPPPPLPPGCGRSHRGKVVTVGVLRRSFATVRVALGAGTQACTAIRSLQRCSRCRAPPPARQRQVLRWPTPRAGGETRFRMTLVAGGDGRAGKEQAVFVPGGVRARCGCVHAPPLLLAMPCWRLCGLPAWPSSTARRHKLRSCDFRKRLRQRLTSLCGHAARRTRRKRCPGRCRAPAGPHP